MKLYRLQTKGLGDYWVIADNAHEADQKLTKLLDAADYGFSKERLVISTALISEHVRDLLPEAKPHFSDQHRLIA